MHFGTVALHASRTSRRLTDLTAVAEPAVILEGGLQIAVGGHYPWILGPSFARKLIVITDQKSPALS